MTSSSTSHLVLSRFPSNRVTFSDPIGVSLHELSQQLPLRLIELVMPYV